MRRTLRRAALAAAAACLLPGVAEAQPPVDVGTLPGFVVSRPKAVDENGDLAGQVARAGPQEQAALWLRTPEGYCVEALDPLPGLLWGDARAFGRGGAPVGFSYLAGSPSVFRAVVWREDVSGRRVAVDLEPPAGFTDAVALAANHHGLIVGDASNPRETINGSTVRHAVAWVPGEDGQYAAVDLGVPDGYDVSGASGVNEPGDVVGTARRLESDGSGGTILRATAVVWCLRHRGRGRHDTDAVLLGTREDLPRIQSPKISNPGMVVATAERAVAGRPLVSRALVWRRTGHGFDEPDELPVPPGFTDAAAVDVNEPGVVAGTVYVRLPQPAPPLASRAVVWRRSKGRYLATLLANPPGTALATAFGLNQRGDVVGNAPLPAPGTSGGLLWPRRGRRRDASAPRFTPGLDGR